MIDQTSFSAILTLLQDHGYAIILLLMIIDGPIVAYAAAFAAALGFFNIYVILILSVLGNLIPDIILYSIGRSMRTKNITKVLNFLGLTNKKIEIIEGKLKRNLKKTLIFSKLVPPLPVPAMMLSGFVKVNFKRFFLITTIFNIFASIIFVASGYYSGFATNNTLEYFKLQEILLPLLIILVVIIYFFIKWLYKKMAKYFN